MYLNNAYSCWLFETFNSNTVIKITLNTDVEPSSPACSGNYIEVFDGSSQVNKLGRLCGRQEGKEYFSTGQSMFLTFHRDNNQTTGGFTLTYQAVSVPSVNWTECNSLHTQVRTVDHSPRYLMYPGNQTNYTNNADCGWLLQTSSYLQDSLIHVTFSFIDTENTNGCDYDYVEIFDGSTSLSNKLTRLCGHMGRREVYSSGQSLFIRFHSDDSNTGRGFSMMYQAISPPDAHPDTGLACSDQVLPQAVPSRTQYLKYPSDFNLYINNVDCSWLLQARDDTYVVHVTFLSVDIEDNRDCSYDYVELFAGVDESAVSMGRVCGSTTRDFYSPGINVFIKFHSDSSNNGRGFRLAYQEVPVSSLIPAGSTCPDQVLPQAVISTAQYLTYPVGSLTYLNNVGCSWRLHTRDIGYIVHVVFTMMNTEQSTSCSYDYVQLYDGSNTFANSLGKLCGSTTGEFYSSGRYMYITFHSDSSNTGRGFQLFTEKFLLRA
ncbi:deleted in malignant brain tumors 1 protein-like isoform X2 [Pomacea canaliculata]|uniref:deleted in malignant brain tumors 1 protein-like isoform X2 n=1 Tax=Pomacea canaliculata TaxID=400727 RepID=UPI000D73BCD4|nr:deleted in malignant brain tumors 1 protein-like isoform X2 [Pomacea canaliculata]